MSERIPWGGWFRLRPPDDGGAGIELTVRIPGCAESVTRHRDRAAAKAAARDIYDEYLTAAAAAKTR